MYGPGRPFKAWNSNAVSSVRTGPPTYRNVQIVSLVLGLFPFGLSGISAATASSVSILGRGSVDRLTMVMTVAVVDRCR